MEEYDGLYITLRHEEIPGECWEVGYLEREEDQRVRESRILGKRKTRECWGVG